MYYKKNNNKDNNVTEIQRMLNKARIKASELIIEDTYRSKQMIGTYKEPLPHLNYIPSEWICINEDGYYGPKTETAVKGFQEFLHIEKNGIVGDTTYDYLKRLLRYSHNGRYQMTNHPKMEVGVSVTFSTIKTTNSVADVFREIDKITNCQSNITGIYNYVNNNKKLALRKRKELYNKASAFLKDVSINGVDSAIKNNSGNITRRDLLNYLGSAKDKIQKAKLGNIRLSSIQKAIGPIIKIFDKIPGLRWAGVLEKLLKSVKRLFMDGDTEGALQLFCNAIRELLETLLVDLAVGALVASGLGILAIVLVVVLFIIDYFFFSDNPGDSLADKYTPLETRNVLNEGVSATLHPDHSGMIIQRGVGVTTLH